MHRHHVAVAPNSEPLTDFYSHFRIFCVKSVYVFTADRNLKIESEHIARHARKTPNALQQVRSSEAGKIIMNNMDSQLDLSARRNLPPSKGALARDGLIFYSTALFPLFRLHLLPTTTRARERVKTIHDHTLCVEKADIAFHPLRLRSRIVNLFMFKVMRRASQNLNWACGIALLTLSTKNCSISVIHLRTGDSFSIRVVTLIHCDSSSTIRCIRRLLNAPVHCRKHILVLLQVILISRAGSLSARTARRLP